MFWWFSHHSRQGNLPLRYDRWRVRWDGSYMSTFSYLQPFPAVLGLVCCCLIIFVFSTATWWNGEPTFRKVATAYAGVSQASQVLSIFTNRIAAPDPRGVLHCFESPQPTLVGRATSCLCRCLGSRGSVEPIREECSASRYDRYGSTRIG
jgi:hypothetical protein